MSATDPSAADGSVVEPPPGPPPAATRTPPVPDRTPPRAFPREARLLNGRAYDAVFGDNRRLADRFWTVLVHRVPPAPGAAPTDAPPSARLGLAVAKKRARRAVDRNRIKRVARESFRHARGTLEGHHVVVMNRDAATSASAAELRRALDTLWSRLLRQSSGQGGGRGSRSSARGRPGRPPVRASARPASSAGVGNAEAASEDARAVEAGREDGSR